MELLLQNGSDVNHQDCLGTTSLIIAVNCYPNEIVEFLLQNGADPLIKDLYSYTALDYSIIKPFDDKAYGTLCRYGYGVKCDPNGQLSQFVNCSSHKMKYLFTIANIPNDVKLSLYYLDACLHLYNIVQFNKKLQFALSFKEHHKIEISYPSSPELYGNRHEIQSERELFFGAQLTPHEAIWQSMLILNRVAGPYSNLTLRLFFRYIIQPLRQFDRLSLSLYKHYTQLLLSYMQNTLPVNNTSSIIRDSYPPIDKVNSMNHSDSISIQMIDAVYSNLAQCVKLYFKYLSKLHCHCKLVVQDIHETEYTVLIKSVMMTIYTFVSNSYGKYAIELLDVCMAQALSFDDVYTTVLHEVLMLGSMEFLDWVLKHGGDRWINTPNSKGQYPLHVIADSLNFSNELFEVLIDNGAHIDSVTPEGITPLSFAQRRYKKLSSIIKRDFYPLPLVCLASHVIVNEYIQYKHLDLPRHIKSFIKLHDSTL
jgi:hypothetical protein